MMTSEDGETSILAKSNPIVLSKDGLQADKRLEMLLDILESIHFGHDLRTISSRTLNHLIALIPHCQAGCVVQFVEANNQARVVAFNLLGQDLDCLTDLNPGLVDFLANLEKYDLPQSVEVLDLVKLSQPDPIQTAFLSEGLSVSLTKPLFIGKDLAGFFSLASVESSSFDSSALPAVNDAAQILSLAFEQDRLHQSEQNRRLQGEILRGMMLSMANTISLGQALELILRNLGQVVRYDRAALYIQNEDSQFQFPAGLGREEHDSKTLGVPKIFPLDDPIIIELRRQKYPLIVDDIQKDERFCNWPEREFVHAWMGVPLALDGEIVGIVSLGDLEAAAYSPEDADLVQMFTDQVAEVFWRARVLNHQETRTEELELITSFSFALQQAKSQENILAVIMDQIAQVFGASQGSFLQLEKDGSSLVVNFSQNTQLVGQWHTHRNDPLWQVIRSHQPVFIPDTSECLAQYPDTIYWQLFQKMRSAALLPLHSPDAIFGVLCFTFRDSLSFSPEDQRLFQAISAIAGTALRRAVVLEGLEKQIHTRTRHLSALYEISAAAAEPVEIEELLAHLLVLTMDVLNSPAGAIHLLDGGKKSLRLAAQVGISQNLRRDIGILPALAPFWRNLLRSDEPVIIANIFEDRRAPLELSESPYAAFISTPIRAKGESMGLLSLLGESVLEYTIEDITLFSTIAEQVGGTVERARLQRQAERAAVAEERQRLARELHDSISQLLYSLVLYAGAGRKVLQRGDLEHTTEYLQRIDQTSLQALKEMRLLVYELRPSVFREEGLVGALNRRLQSVEKRTGINAQLIVEGNVAFDDSIELSLYRIAEEALNNTLKHAQATQVIVRISVNAGYVDLEIQDNGRGFELQVGQNAGGLGLIGIQERVSQLGGELDIHTAPGQGVDIKIHLEVGDE